MTWRPSHAITSLQGEVNTAHPGRSTISDGTKGDPAHAGRVSDHNPDPNGIVHAWDCTVWDGPDADQADDVANPLAEFLRARRDPRTKYVIHRGQMFASYRTATREPWQWGPYTGPNGHFYHVHISVYGDDGAPWGYPTATNLEEPLMVTPADETKIAAIIDARLKDALEPIHKALGDLHRQWIGNQGGAPTEALRSLLRDAERRTGEIVIDTRKLTEGR